MFIYLLFYKFRFEILYILIKRMKLKVYCYKRQITRHMWTTSDVDTPMPPQCVVKK